MSVPPTTPTQPAEPELPAEIVKPAESEPAERIYFPELDGLRFVAFLMVYLFHGGVPWGVLARPIGRQAALGRVPR